MWSGAMSRGIGIVAIGLVFATAAEAQPSRTGFRLGGGVSATTGEGSVAPAVGLAASYRFGPRFGLELDASYLPKIDLGEFPNCPPPLVCILGGNYSLDARAVSLTGNVVAALPSGVSWMQPYVVAGIGVAHVRRQHQDVFFAARRWQITTTKPTVTFGGGVEFPAGRRLGLGLDIRYQPIFEDRPALPVVEPTLNLTRIGATLSYRF